MEQWDVHELWGRVRTGLADAFLGEGAGGFARQGRVEPKELDARAAYDLWAPSYGQETVTSFLDEELARGMMTGLPRVRLLDAGCGIGRRIAAIPGAVGVDRSPEMVAASVASNVVVGDVRALPFPSQSFDMVWCRLVLGHLPSLWPAYQELARVAEPGGYVFVTDFHPDAVAAGHKRTFTDAEGVVHSIEHYIHANHLAMAEDAGLVLVDSREGAVGPSVRDFYLRGLGAKAYRRDTGLKIVAAYLFRRPGTVF